MFFLLPSIHIYGRNPVWKDTGSVDLHDGDHEDSVDVLPLSTSEQNQVSFFSVNVVAESELPLTHRLALVFP